MAEKKKRGRRGTRKQDFLADGGLTYLRGWARAGYTKTEIAKLIGVSLGTLESWVRKDPKVKRALKKGVDFANFVVEDKLQEVIEGYYYTETVSEIPRDEEGNPKKGVDLLVTKKTEKYAHPNITAIIFWLKNRFPEIWRSADRDINEILRDRNKPAEEKLGAITKVIKTGRNKAWGAANR